MRSVTLGAEASAATRAIAGCGASFPAWKRRAGFSGSLFRRGLFGGAPGDRPLQAAGARRQLVVARLGEERVDAAAMFDRAQRMRRDAQLDALAERFTEQRNF